MKKIFLSLIVLCFCVGVAQANSLQTCKSYFDKQFFEKSADCYANFVDKEPRNAQYRVLRSISLYYAKDYKEALSEATTATKLYPALNSEKAFSQMMKDCKQRLAEIQKSQYRDYGDYANKIK